MNLENLKDLELLAALSVLVYDRSSDSLFESVQNADEIALVLENVESEPAVVKAVETLCEAGIIWQVLHAGAKRLDEEALYDDIARVLSSGWTHGPVIIEKSATWAFLNRRHNTYEWLESALDFVSDPVVIAYVKQKWPRLYSKGRPRFQASLA